MSEMYEAVAEVRRMLDMRMPTKLVIEPKLYSRLHAEIKKHQQDFGLCVLYRWPADHEGDKPDYFVIYDAPDWYPGVLFMGTSIWPDGVAPDHDDIHYIKRSSLRDGNY